MASITRSTKVSGGTTLASNTLARAVDVETDILTLFNAHNNHNSGSSKWSVVSAEHATSVPLVVNNSTGTQNIAEFKDNGTNVMVIADGGAVTLSTKILAPNSATASAPPYSFDSDTDNGMYMAGSDNLGFSVGGTKRLDLTTSTMTTTIPLAMSSQKITGLAEPTVNGDAVANNVWTSFTPTISGFGTCSGVSFFYKIIGDEVFVKGYFVTGTVQAATATMTLPASKTIASAKLPSVTKTAVTGIYWWMVNTQFGTGTTGALFADPPTSTSLIYFCTTPSGAVFAAQNGNAIGGDNDGIAVQFSFPI